ncbi:TonB-dependent receptor [uncultured Desulfobacter sp.]|uniref:TonB-dependent receptor plug domain-containing protein n=1 Tax=uncultured Desulfobacter sp. TaxID=240139 RepID=UPI002AA89A79|nr:TonB-dependent receptor [uncultured Desulfobacter sp.]
MRHCFLSVFLAMAVSLMPLSVQARESETNLSSVQLDKMVVTATKTAHTMEDVPVETILITSEDIERSSAKTVSGLLSDIPGFNFSQQSDLTGAMGYKNTVRGLNVESRYLLVLVDGQRVFTGYHAGGMASAGFSHNVNVVPVSMIDRIEVVKGPGSALYGSDAMVGVLNIITKQPTRDTKVTVGGGYRYYTVDGNTYLFVKPSQKHRSSFETHATVSGSFNDKVRGTLGVSHEENDGINPDIYDVFQNYVHGRIVMDPTDNFQVRAGAEFTQWQAQNNDLDDKKTEDAPRLWASADYAFNRSHKIKIQTYYQKLDADFSDQDYGIQQADVNYRDLEMQYTGHFFDAHLLTLGMEYLEEDFSTNLVETNISTSSFYAQDEWSLMDNRLILVPGVRFDDNDVYGQEWNPKFSAMYKPLLSTRLRFSTGYSFKAPTAIQSSADPINHVSMYVLSNSCLEPERAFTIQAGIEQDFLNARLVLGVTGFYSDIDDLITMAATDQLLNGLPAVMYQNVNSAEIKGIEVTADAELMAWLHLLLTYAYTDARDKDTNDRLVDTPEHAVSVKLDYDNEKYRFGSTLSLSYTSDQLNTDYGIGGSLVTDEYTSVGLKVWKDILKNARISVEAANIFNQSLTGSDTIHVDQSVMARLNFTF